MACITLSKACHSITTHASAESTYLGQTKGSCGIGVCKSSSQAYVLVKMIIQRAEEKLTGATHQSGACKHRWRAPNLTPAV